MFNYLLLSLKLRFRSIWVMLFGFVVPIVFLIAQQFIIGHGDYDKMNALSGTIFYGILSISLTSFSNEVVQRISFFRRRRLRYFNISINKLIFCEVVISTVLSLLLMVVLILMCITFYGYSHFTFGFVCLYLFHLVFLILFLLVFGYTIANVTRNVKVCTQVSLLMFFVILYLSRFIISTENFTRSFDFVFPFSFVHGKLNAIILGHTFVNISFLVINTVWILLLFLINKYFIPIIKKS